MIILDTNVVSELMLPIPVSHVIAWMAQQAAALLYLSTVSEAESRHGVAVVPTGQRRDRWLRRIPAEAAMPAIDSSATQRRSRASRDRRPRREPAGRCRASRGGGSPTRVGNVWVIVHPSWPPRGRPAMQVSANSAAAPRNGCPGLPGPARARANGQGGQRSPVASVRRLSTGDYADREIGRSDGDTTAQREQRPASSL